MRWIVEDGRSINFMTDSWIANLSLARWPTFILMEIPDSIFYLWSFGFEWYSAESIDGHSDFWRYFGSEDLINCFAYSFLRWMVMLEFGDPLLFLEFLCRTYSLYFSRRPRGVWILDGFGLLGYIREWAYFCGKLHCFSMKAFLIARGLHLPPSCPACKADSETLVHVMFLCPRACQVWRIAGFDGLIMHAVVLVDTFLELLWLSIAHSPSTFLAYIAYHIWLTWNAIIFSSYRCPTRVIVERARAHVEEYQTLTVVTMETWGSGLALRVPYRIFISWEFPSPRNLMINFDGNVRDRQGVLPLSSMALDPV